MDCSQFLVFILIWCLHLDIANSQGCTVTPSNTQTIGIDPDNTEPTRPPAQATAECPPEGILKIPHKYDCTRYYFCINGTQLEQQCAPGHRFDFPTTECLIEAEAECVSGATVPPEVICPNPGGPYFAPHPFDCRKYYLCLNENPTERTCTPEGYLFDVRTLQCQPPGPNVQCAGGSTTPQPTTTTTSAPIPNICSPTENHISYHPYDCSKYIWCINGQPIQQSCPTGQLFDHLENKCVPESVAICHPGATTTRPEPENPCPNNQPGLAAHPYDCSQYFVCMNGSGVPLYCSNGYLYDPSHESCTIASEACCFPGATTGPPRTTITSTIPPPTTAFSTESPTAESSTVTEISSTITIITMPPTTTQPTTTTDNSTTSTPTPPTTPGTTLPPLPCPDTGIINQPDRYDCTKYYTCVDGQMTPMFCPQYQIFDIIKRMCDYPYNGGVCYEGATTTPPTFGGGIRLRGLWVVAWSFSIVILVNYF